MAASLPQSPSMIEEMDKAAAEVQGEELVHVNVDIELRITCKSLSASGIYYYYQDTRLDLLPVVVGPPRAFA